jgi:hypothetical protein
MIRSTESSSLQLFSSIEPVKQQECVNLDVGKPLSSTHVANKEFAYTWEFNISVSINLVEESWRTFTNNKMQAQINQIMRHG